MLRILLAEDNKVNQKVVVRMLQKLGQDADVASNGHEAVSLAQKSRYDVIFMDLMMPQLDGFDAARRIRGMEPADHRALIIALTANAMGSDRSRCLEAGMDDFMMKPFMLGTLKEKLNSIIHARPNQPHAATDPDVSQQDDLVDRSVLRSLASMVDENDSAYLKELLNEYLTDAERLRGEIYESIQSANAQSLRQASHSLKSTSAMFGALRLSELCADFERSAIEQNFAAVQPRLAEFDETLEAVHAALVEMVEAEAY
jgi:CheY-like chemotaxis protein/HPt (histidine-containing phosphotransfer) domain-containing protein